VRASIGHYEDVVKFTSGVGSAGYQGYLIDKTIFLVATAGKRDLTFTSTSPTNHALLKATASLKGFVVRLWARSRVFDPGDIDDITISHLNLDGNRSARVCYGPDGVGNGISDNWGSWLTECTIPNDPWCSPGGLGMDGGMDWSNQNYAAHLGDWSTGLIVDDLRISNTECGTALAMGAAASTIKNTTIDTAGDHVHAPGCARTDNDEANGAWSDGITFTGPNHAITGNTIINPSDVGIVFFGGRNTVISSNTIQTTSGNYGAFAGIAIHAWIFGDV
jgi:parallel beta-helix repeat protein